MRRANGTGTIVKLSGNRRRPYSVRVAQKDKYGRIVQKAIGYFATAKEAQEALDEHNRLKALGLAPAINQMNMTVGQVYEAWSARAFAKISASGVCGYKAAWNQRISRFADRKMRDMTLDEWQSILDMDEKENASQSLINKDVTVIKGLYSYSMERDIVGKDYSAYLDIPSVEPKMKKGILTDLQIAKLEQLAKEGFPWADTVLMLCYTGFRISEFLSLTRFNYHSEYGGYLQGGLKTKAGTNRIVPVHPKIAPYLSHWLEKNTDTIISKDGKPVRAQWYRKSAFMPVMEALGAAEAPPHWCRHTFATRLHDAGTDPLTTKWLMGHSTENDITEHYTHETIGVLVKGIRKLA
ncbi:MAG: tyrosine-type recombinase/integrase [Oscillospiraceae bacterium]|nr:tyrosine-type recombinase/integrase [Oscillospiraceae bacterium]